MSDRRGIVMDPHTPDPSPNTSSEEEGEFESAEESVESRIGQD